MEIIQVTIQNRPNSYNPRPRSYNPVFLRGDTEYEIHSFVLSRLSCSGPIQEDIIVRSRSLPSPRRIQRRSGRSLDLDPFPPRAGPDADPTTITGHALAPPPSPRTRPGLGRRGARSIQHGQLRTCTGRRGDSVVALVQGRTTGGRSRTQLFMNTLRQPGQTGHRTRRKPSSSRGR